MSVLSFGAAPDFDSVTMLTKHFPKLLDYCQIILLFSSHLLVRELIRMWLSDTVAQEIVWSDEDLFPVFEDTYQEFEDEAPWSDEGQDGYSPEEMWDVLAEDAYLDAYWECLHDR